MNADEEKPLYLVQRERTKNFIAFMEREIPGFKIRFKDDKPKSMPARDRLMHAVARILVKDYDTRFTTVIYPTIYLPAGSRHMFQNRPERYYSTLRHEFIHLKDYQRFHIFFAVSYVAFFPIVYTMRAYWELRGYAQNMICAFEREGFVSENEVDRISEIFAGPSYIFMLWPRSLARKHLEKLRQQILAGKLGGVYPYGPLDTPLPPDHT